MKIVVLASKEVGSKCVGELLNQGYLISRILTEPCDKEIIALAESNCIETVLFPEALSWLESQEHEAFDWLINLWSSRILTETQLNKAKYKMNLHPSYVPHCLGSDTATWTLLTDAPVGVSILDMSPRVDEGGVYVTKKLDRVYPERAVDLQQRLKKASVDLFSQQVGAVLSGETPSVPLSEIKSKFRRSETVNSQLKNIAELTTDQKAFLDWVLAHDFSEDTQAGIQIGDKIIRLQVAIEHAGE